MNLNEFNALKPGDRIENAMSGSTGEVVEADTKGVRVCWGLAPDTATGSRHYSRFSTIWFHWSKVEADPAATFTDEQWNDALKGEPT